MNSTEFPNHSQSEEIAAHHLKFHPSRAAPRAPVKLQAPETEELCLTNQSGIHVPETTAKAPEHVGCVPTKQDSLENTVLTSAVSASVRKQQILDLSNTVDVGDGQLLHIHDYFPDPRLRAKLSRKQKFCKRLNDAKKKFGKLLHKIFH